MELSIKEKKSLLCLARKKIESIYTGETIDNSRFTEPVFLSKLGVFVTITKFGDLRGCIGYITSNDPLYITIQNAAEHAAQNDRRFQALQENELEEIKLEISILSEPYPMKSYDEIVIGKHGLILEELGMRAVLLPQVPVEHNLNRDEYLSALCRKAGIYTDYWKEKTLNISMFTATVFSEDKLDLE